MNSMSLTLDGSLSVARDHSEEKVLLLNHKPRVLSLGAESKD